MKILGLSGKIGVGKSSIRSDICLAGRFASRALGDAIKEELASLTGLPLQLFYMQKEADLSKLDGVSVECTPLYVEGVKIPRKVCTVRDLIQWWGGVRRDYYKDYWIDKLRLWTGQFDSERTVVVVDDCRMTREFEFVKSNGGILVKIEPYWDSWRDSDSLVYPERSKACYSDVTETELDAWKHWDLTLKPLPGQSFNYAAEVIKLFAFNYWRH